MKTLHKVLASVDRLGPLGFLRFSVNYSRWRIYRDLFGQRFREARVNDYRLLLDLHDVGIAKELMLHGTREEEHTFMLKRFLREGMTVLDCGANIGYYAVMMAKLVGDAGRVYAVEPALPNLHLLNVNVRLNGLEGRVESFNLGLSDRVGVEPFHLSVMCNRHTFCPAEHGTVDTELYREARPIEVPVETLGSFFDKHLPADTRIDLVRMDIEGYEVEVIRSLIADGRPGLFPALLFEVHSPKYDRESRDMEAPLRKLFELGYTVHSISSDRHRSRGGAEAFASRGYGDEHVLARFPVCDRVVYEGVRNEDALELMCRTENVRAVLLAKR